MAFQILASDKIIKLNDFPLLGQVQNVNWDPTLNTEEIYELGRDTRIAAAQELETTGSFEILSIGGTAGILARMIVRRSAGAFTGYMFRESLSAPGTPGAAGSATAGDTTTVTNTGVTWTSGAWVGYYVTMLDGTASNIGLARKITANTTTSLTVSPAFTSAVTSGDDYKIHGGPNRYTITQSDLKECLFDLVINEKSDQQTFDRSSVLPRCYPTTLSGRADAGGNASETINFSGDFVAVAPAPYHDVRCIPATRTDNDTVTLVLNPGDTTVASTTHGLAFLYVDAQRLKTTGTYAATLGNGVVDIAGGYIIPATAVSRAIVWDNTTPTTSFPAVIERQTPEFYVRGYMASIFISPADPNNPTAAAQWLRAQTIDWNIDLRVEALRQIAYNDAGTSVYARVPTFPFTITANVSTFESDWTEWKAMFDTSVKPFANTGTNFYGETYDFSPISFKDSFYIVVDYYTKAGVLMQRLKFADMKPDSMGTRVNVGGRAEVTWSFRGTAVSWDGYNL